MKFILCFCSGICISGTSCHKKSLDVKVNSSISFQRILWVGCSLGEDGTAVTAPANGRESQGVCTGFRKPSKRSIAVVSGKARQGKKDTCRSWDLKRGVAPKILSTFHKPLLLWKDCITNVGWVTTINLIPVNVNH